MEKNSIIAWQQVWEEKPVSADSAALEVDSLIHAYRSIDARDDRIRLSRFFNSVVIQMLTNR